MKKVLTFLAGALAATTLFAGCSTAGAAGAGTDTQAGGASPITVVSREDGSGTRGAFVELFGVEEKNESGEKVDNTTLDAVTVNSTSVMMTTVAGDPAAVGYISLGSLNDSVKALEIDGVAATVANIKNGSYKIARPFNIATKDDVSEAAKDFIDFILSAEGQVIVEENGYIPEDGASAFAGGKTAGKVVVAGSSSVTPLMEKLKEAYGSLNPNTEIEIQQSDSSTGMTATIDGVCDIGMASRELKDSELESGLVPTVIAMDGIAVIVNTENDVEGLSSETVKDIFVGTLTAWEEVE